MDSTEAFTPSVVMPQPPLVRRASTLASMFPGAGHSSSSPPRKTSTAFVPHHLRRSLSNRRSEQDLRFDVFFQLPNLTELQRLRVHRSVSLIALQAMLQREFGIPFEDQRLYLHGDLLEGDEDLAFYEIHDQSVIAVRSRKRYRSIGDIFTKIKTVQFIAKTHPEDFELVEVVAALPPLRIVFRRLTIIITYITMLDRMQFTKTNRRVWKEHVSFWDEPRSSVVAVAAHANAFATTSPTANALRRNSQLSANTLTTLAAASTAQATNDTNASFVMRRRYPERVSHLMALAHAHNVHERLQLPPESRSGADVRHIRKWLSSIKYFANASLPDAAYHDIAKHSVYARYKSGDYIFRQGDVGEFFYIVISGCISLAAYGNGFFATMTPGTCFGEISLFEVKGVRTASANVNFAAPYAELAVLPGEVYRRAINPFKQAVLHNTEKAVYSIPQLRSLPDNVLTHIAYASKTLNAKMGKRLIRHGDELNVLVLLISGEVKVATPQSRKQSTVAAATTATTDASHTLPSTARGYARGSSKFESSLNQAASEPHFPIVSVVHAPAVFGQEGCLSNTPEPAPWDIDAIDTCTIVCLRTDTISILLAPRRGLQTAIRSAPPATAGCCAPSDVLSAQASVITFPKVLMKGEHVVASTDKSPVALRGGQSSRAPAAARRQTCKVVAENSLTTPANSNSVAASKIDGPWQQQRAQTAPASCGERQDAFLHHALSHGNILALREQLQFVSFEEQQRAWTRQQQQQRPQRSQKRQQAGRTKDEQRVEAKTQALLQGLRRLQAQDVEMILVPAHSADKLSVKHAHATQFHFATINPTLNT
ncbi:Camp-dependent protein kinase type ii regulatory subunit, partial [Globisporangium splendens]